ncbi:TIGR03756 family integrating conjugative element protein [Caviibacterium pharyngocola]|uniref:TIGR03756 family integrating conjugative element protein n=2 Tax=Caviibacterium pharyngocola TaxID=28159 RepID=A0A2M8RV74_9PAST|nr:TIGR03756 family integrating conjugative element protein [Caviibacterium pharyngocola]PJG82802.1 TIGR03756 family integrating conjugative element protein [Caviibacterium pharyngocola]
MITTVTVMLPYTPRVVATNINTASIMASSASSQCLEYRVVGTCFWLFCTYWGCKIRTSVKVRHFIPELVVSVYNHEGQNPWSEMSLISQGIAGGAHKSPERQFTQLNFKNADAIGHPQGAISQMLRGAGYYCKSQTTPFMPYFLSSLDYFAWRQGLPEMFYPEAFTFGLREIKTNGDVWGNIYPRSGSITQIHDYKASAVIAHRVADIVSRTGQLHIYQSAAQTGGQGNWYPKPVKEGNANNHKWQMLAPAMSRSCSIFPNGGATDTYSSQLSEQGNYAWALWRPYSCCKRRGQKFLYSIDWYQPND